MTDSCHTCGAPIVGFDSVHFGSIEAGYRDLCSRCFNEEVADLGEVDFQHVNFEPVDTAIGPPFISLHRTASSPAL